MKKDHKSASLGKLPAIIVICVTWVVGIKSCQQAGEVLNLGGLVWGLYLGFTASEFLILSWFFEPQKGGLNKDQLRRINYGKVVILLTTAIEAGLLVFVMRAQSEGVPIHWAIAPGQVVLAISTIIFSAWCSMQVVELDANRIIALDNANAQLKESIARSKLRTENKLSKVRLKLNEKKVEERIMKDTLRYMQLHLGSKASQESLKAEGARIAGAILGRWKDRADRILREGEIITEVEDLHSWERVIDNIEREGGDRALEAAKRLLEKEEGKKGEKKQMSPLNGSARNGKNKG